MRPVEIEIGYLCARGHYCFYADPEEGGQCGSKRVGTITLSLADGVDMQEVSEAATEADDHLHDVIATWRAS